MMELLAANIVNGISIVKENCLTSIAAVAEVSGKKYEKYFSPIAEIIVKILTSFPGS